MDQRCPGAVSLLDVAPTCLRAAGVPIPADLDGVALQNYFDDPEWSARTDAYGSALLEDLPPAVMLSVELARNSETLLKLA